MIGDETKIEVLSITYICPEKGEMVTVSKEDFFFPHDEYSHIFIDKCAACGGQHKEG